MTSMHSLITCAIQHNLTLCDINGHIGHWIETCRNSSGQRPSTEEFKAAFEELRLAKIEADSRQPSNSYEEYSGK